MRVMILFGIGEVIGALLQGWLIDKYQSRNATIFNFFLVIVSPLQVLRPGYSVVVTFVPFIIISISTTGHLMGLERRFGFNSSPKRRHQSFRSLYTTGRSKRAEDMGVSE